MSKAIYPVINGSTRKGTAIYAVIDSLTKKVMKGYRVDGGLTRQFYNGGDVTLFSYTGNYDAPISVEIAGVTYDLYALTSAGTLTLGTKALYWMCGGGGGGVSGKDNGTSARSGNGGGGGFVTDGELRSNTYVVTIGAGGTSDNDGTETTIIKANGETYTIDGGKADGTGASGGGGGVSADDTLGNASGAAGAGVSTYPFGLTSLKAHSAGGGSGGAGLRLGNNSSYPYRYIQGAAGGTNGSDGATSTNKSTSSTSQPTNTSGGAGGVYGGGAGATVYHSSYTGSTGGNATFYGSAGGGGYAYERTNSTFNLGKGGAGHQGVVYIAVPGAVLEGIVITKQPESQAAVAGDTVTFHVEATGVASYQWQFSTDDGATWNNLTWTGYNTATMTRTMTANAIQHQYRCKLTGLDGSVVYTDVIYFAPVIITKQPENVTASIGDTVTFSLEASGNISMYRWQRSTDGGNTFSAVYWGNSGFDTAAFTFTVSDEGRLNGLYRCMVYCADGDAYNVASDVVSITPA